MAHPVLGSQSSPNYSANADVIRSKGNAHIFHLLRNREIGKSNINFSQKILNLAEVTRDCVKIMQEMKQINRAPSAYKTQVNSKEVYNISKFIAPLIDEGKNCQQLQNFSDETRKVLLFFFFEKIISILKKRIDSKRAFSNTITAIHSVYRIKINRQLIEDFEKEFQEIIERSISKKEWKGTSTSVIDSLTSYIDHCEGQEKAVLKAVKSCTITNLSLNLKKNLGTVLLVIFVAIVVLDLYLVSTRGLPNHFI